LLLLLESQISRSVLDIIYKKNLKWLSRFRGVTIDAVWIGELDLLAPYTHKWELQAITALSVIPIYNLLLLSLMFSVWYSLLYPFPANGF
jgi:hypothetical protein